MPDRLAKTLVDAAMELHRCRLWDAVPPDSPFLIRVAGEEALVAILIGQAKSDYGLMLLRGEGAFRWLLRMVEEDRHPSFGDEWDMLSVTFDPLSTIPEDFRTPLRAAGFSARAEQAAPLFFLKERARQLRPLRREEMRVLASCLTGILRAADSGELRAGVLDRRRRTVLEIGVEREADGRRAELRRVPWPKETAVVPTILDIEGDFGGIPRLDERWIAALSGLPASIEGDERSVRAFVLVEEETEFALTTTIVLGDDLRPVAEKLAKVFQGDNDRRKAGLPREILFVNSSLHDALAPALASLEVHTAIGEGPAFLPDLIELLRENMSDPEGTPETLEEWKEVDRRVTARLHEDAVSRGLVNPRSLARYFGSEEKAEEVFSELETLSPFPAFLEWLICDYRPTARSKTQIEKLLAHRRLDPAERVILEARRTAEFSIYRVDATEPGATLTIEDIFSGERRVVNDSAMSGCGLEGFILPLRLSRVKEWYFPSFGGPPMGSFDVDQCLRHFQFLGIELSRKVLRRDPHLVGTFWCWAIESRRHPPKIQNTDGDPLERQTATFLVADRDALTAALDARPDIEGDPDGTWIWLRPGGPVPGFGKNTILGNLELHDDRLVLEVNSARRLERAREWLEQIPGVRFERALAGSPETREQRPLDDRLPGPPPAPLSPAMLAKATQTFHEMCRRWLDERVPALGNRTPRQNCKTAAGRRRVAQLVRTMPAMRIPGGSIEVPREELLRELGIQE